MKFILPLQTDQYKLNGHFRMLPDDVETVYSYMEARKGATYDATTFFGLQYYIKRYILPEVTKEDLDFAEKFAKQTNFHDTPFNREGWDYIVNELGGKLPIRIKAVKEGTTVPTGNVLLTIENTDDKCAWLTNYIETLLMKLWYPLTLAYRSNQTSEFLMQGFDESSDLPREVAKHLYIDFGYRGVTSEEQAAIGGAAHALSNYGSDTPAATLLLHEYYNNNVWGEVGEITYGVPASEHSIGTSKGVDGEFAYYLGMLQKFPDGIVSVVADSYNVVRFVEEYTKEMKPVILERWMMGKGEINRTVLRPDSDRFEGDTPSKQIIWFHEELDKIFGHTTNSKGKKVLHPAIGVLYADGISDIDIRNMITDLIDAGWSTENLALGQGGGLLNAGDTNTRDTNRFAIKVSASKQGGEWVDIQKNPLDVTKKSKSGRLLLHKDIDGTYHTLKQDENPTLQDELVTVFENGELLVEYTVQDVRDNINGVV